MVRYTVGDKQEKKKQQMASLEDRLTTLACEWRGSRGDLARRKKIRQEYHNTMKQLYKMGWDSILDWESHLPDEEMPEEYTSRHPRPRSPLTGSLSPKE